MAVQGLVQGDSSNESQNEYYRVASSIELVRHNYCYLYYVLDYVTTVVRKRFYKQRGMETSRNSGSSMREEQISGLLIL